MSAEQVPQRLSDLAKRSRGPRSLSDAALNDRFGELEQVDVKVGQVWRARWEEASVLLLILAVEEDTGAVRAVPVTIDPSGEDERAVVVDGPRTTFGVEVTVWAGLEAALGQGVLDQPLDAWEDDLVEAVARATAGKPGPVPAGTRAGRSPASVFDRNAEVRAEVADDLASLREAPRLPVQEPDAAVVTPASLLHGRLDLAHLTQALGMPQAEVMDLLRGKVPLRPDQVGVLAEATGVPADQLAGASRPLPTGLAREAERPRMRAVWRRRAREQGVSEAQARLSGAYEVFALAARETGGKEADWAARLRHHVRSRGWAGGGG